MSELQKVEEDLYSKQSDEIEKIVVQPLLYIIQIPGKKIRGKISKALNHWVNIPEDKLQKIENIVELLHNASLILDDIQDFSILRRGVPAAHLIFGTPATIAAANYAGFGTIFEKVLELQHPEAIKIYIEQCLELYRGQGMEIFWRDNFLCPTEEEYKQMCIRKTGGLFVLAIRLMQLFCEDQMDLIKLGENLGLYFQIRDDYLNLCSEEYSTKKSFCDDIAEGKFSFPIINAIRSRPDDKRILDLLKSEKKDDGVKKSCLSLIKEFGSFRYTENALIKLKGEILTEVEYLSENPYLTGILDMFSNLDK